MGLKAEGAWFHTNPVTKEKLEDKGDPGNMAR